jgi:hypothetical protein
MSLANSRQVTVLKSFAFAQVDDLLLMYLSNSAPGDEDWNIWIERVAHGPHRGMMIQTLEASPTPAQRARLMHANQAARAGAPLPPVAILTDSVIVRTVMRAFSWLARDDQRTQAFAPSKLEPALAWLEVSAPHAHVAPMLERLRHLVERE